VAYFRFSLNRQSSGSNAESVCCSQTNGTQKRHVGRERENGHQARTGLVKIQLAHDWDKMHQLLGEDFQLIESDGSLGDADSMITGYQEEAPRVVTITMTLLVSHAVTDDCVVATGLDDIALKDKDGNLSHRYERFTDVWVHRNKQWVCVAEQITLAHR
jgi:hypothetical protein